MINSELLDALTPDVSLVLYADNFENFKSSKWWETVNYALDGLLEKIDYNNGHESISYHHQSIYPFWFYCGKDPKNVWQFLVKEKLTHQQIKVIFLDQELTPQWQKVLGKDNFLIKFLK